MRWIKFGIVIIAVLIGAYVASMYYFVEESKTYKEEKEVSFPLEKVYSQFSNFQNFTTWNSYFSTSKTMQVDYFTPYEGEGAAMRYTDKKRGISGEMFIRYAKENKILKYHLFEGNNEKPITVKVMFKPKGADKTEVKWEVETPKLSVWERAENFWSDDSFITTMGKSITVLSDVLGNKVDKDLQIANMKYDSIMVEQREGDLLLGVSASTKNDKGRLLKSVEMNQNKVINFMKMDLSKRDDEYGLATLVMDADGYKDKEVSYYIGASLSKREAVSDNNFTFRTLNPSKMYYMYYKGDFNNRVKSIQQLLQKAKRDTMRNNDVEIQFIEPLEEGKDCVLKISLPVYR